MNTSLFDKLLFKESGISPEFSNLYREKWNEKVINYFDVERPGLIKRDFNTGVPIMRNMTYKEYFESLGISHLIQDLDYPNLYSACFSVMNPWGFIGVQLGESALYSIGVYLPETFYAKHQNVPSYYDYVFENQNWAKGNKSSLAKYPNSNAYFMCTHVNEWKGRFTGKFGVSCFDDLKIPEIQTKATHQIWKYGVKILSEKLGLIDGNLDHILSHLKKNRILRRGHTESSILAAIHLVGPLRFYEFVNTLAICTDENGTSIQSYLDEFAGLSINRSEFNPI